MSCVHKTNYKFKHSAACHASIFGLFTKAVLLKVVHALKFYQHTQFNGLAMTVVSFASTLGVRTSHSHIQNLCQRK
jgi:hypothetical protein